MRKRAMNQTQFSSGHALIIGVGGDLPNTVDDAKGLADILKDPARCGYPSEQVTLLTSQSANRSEILNALDRLAKNADENSTAIIYFSGHGYKTVSTSGDLYYLIPYGYDINKLNQTAISSSEFVDKIKAICAKKMLLLLDCCHAGGFSDLKAPEMRFVKEAMPPEAKSLLAEGSGRVVIASSQSHEQSYAGEPYSAFTLALIEALCGKEASKKDGYVRVSDLIMYIGKAVPQLTNNLQNPILNFDEPDNFILAYYAGGDTQPKSLPFTQKPEINLKPEKQNRVVFDQKGQKVKTQTNVGHVQGNLYIGDH
jgi:uncharacterized caspase-like protein